LDSGSDNQRHVGSRWRRAAGLAVTAGIVLFVAGIAGYFYVQYRIYQSEKSLETSAVPTSVVTSTGGLSTPTSVIVQSMPSQTASLTPTTIPLPKPVVVPSPPTRIVISRISVDAPVTPVGVGSNGVMEAPGSGAGWYIYSGYPGRPGNVVVTGHVDIEGQLFRNLDRLEPGDEVIIYNMVGEYRYVIDGKKIVLPTESSVLNQTLDSTLTLITCTPFGIDTHRLIVTGKAAPDK
jgi:LPXTG-site transpeptidase (sortase) family protein